MNLNGKIKIIIKKILSINFFHKALFILSRVGVIPPIIYAGFPVNKIANFTIKEYQFKYHLRTGDEVGMPMYWEGVTFESETMKPFIDLIKSANCFIDIGANTGIYSLLAASVNKNCKVFSFEPMPDSYDALVRNIAINNYENIIHPIKKAVSNIDDVAQFNIPYNSVFASSASLDIDGFRGFKGSSIEVNVVTIDKFLVDTNSNPDLIKIDVEGFEDRVLEGMRGLLDRHHPAIILECLSDGPAKEITDILTDYSYRFYHLTDIGLVENNKITPDVEDNFKNWVCVNNKNPVVT
jgi:FkbM family methyltransferase